MPENLTRKILRAHLLDGDLVPGSELSLKVDQVLLQDATGTLVWQQFETLDLPAVRVPTVQYVDHNLLQTGYENSDDHLYLQSACARFGAVLSRPGNGISHFANLERYGRPGALLLGCDSPTCQAGALAMLGVGAGGCEVAAVMAGLPFHVRMPRVVRVDLLGTLGPWVSAKDVILEVVRRLTVTGDTGKVLEYVGEGLRDLGVYERSTIANMGQESGATGTVFPSDARTRRFLVSQGRGEAFRPMRADARADYDEELRIDLSTLEPLVACPFQPDQVVPVRTLAGMEVKQVAVGSSVNSSYRDLAIVAAVLKGRHVAKGLHVTLSPGSRQILVNLLRAGVFMDVIRAGVRALEIACGPCIGMGAAPPTGGGERAYLQSQLPGTKRHGGRSRVPREPGNGGGDGAHRSVDRSAGSGRGAKGTRARALCAAHRGLHRAAIGRVAGCAPEGTEHRGPSDTPGARPACRREGAAQARRPRLDRRHPAGGKQRASSSVQHPAALRAHVRIRRRVLCGAGARRGRGVRGGG
jgi:aconitate hydratase